MKKGFTLIELIVVIIIVGILASVGMTQYTKVVEKGRYAEARSVLGSLRTLQNGFHLESTGYDTVANLDSTLPIAAACAASHFFWYSCDTTSGTCTATRCLGANGKQPGATGTALTKTLTIDGTFGGTATGY